MKVVGLLDELPALVIPGVCDQLIKTPRTFAVSSEGLREMYFSGRCSDMSVDRFDQIRIRRRLHRNRVAEGRDGRDNGVFGIVDIGHVKEEEDTRRSRRSNPLSRAVLSVSQTFDLPDPVTEPPALTQQFMSRDIIPRGLRPKRCSILPSRTPDGVVWKRGR